MLRQDHDICTVRNVCTVIVGSTIISNDAMFVPEVLILICTALACEDALESARHRHGMSVGLRVTCPSCLSCRADHSW